MEYDYYDPYDEPIEPQEPRPWSRFDIVTIDNGCFVYWSTNDDLDHGYPSEYASDTYRFDSVEEALDFTGRSRFGVLADVTVTLDGEKV